MEKAGTGMRHMFKDCILKNYSAGQEKLLGRKSQTSHHFLLLLKCLDKVLGGCRVKELNSNLIAHSVHLLYKNDRFFNTHLSFNWAYFFRLRIFKLQREFLDYSSPVVCLFPPNHWDPVTIVAKTRYPLTGVTKHC